MKIALTEFQEQQQPRRRAPSSSTAACGVKALSDSSTISSLRPNANEAAQITTDVPIGCITFDSFASIIDQGRQTQTEDDDECHHMHFLCIVNEYQTRCDSQGKYLLAKDFLDHLVCLTKEAESRVVEKAKNMLANDRAKIVQAHEKQLDEFAQSELSVEYMYHFYFTPLKSHSQRLPSQLRLGRISCRIRTEITTIHDRNATNSQAAAGLTSRESHT